MLPKTNANRRSNRRVSLCRLVKISFSKKTHSAELSHVTDTSGAELLFHVTNLSDSGFQLSAPGLEKSQPAYEALTQIKRDDTLFFRLKLDPQHSEISLLGKIAWVTRERTKSGIVQLKAGIAFLDIADSDLKLIQVFVSAFQS